MNTKQRWTVAKWNENADVLLCDGAIISITYQEIALLLNERDKLQKFKQYVHDRLDRMGIPVDPEPENNAVHGCRIEGRLNVVERLLGNNVA